MGAFVPRYMDSLPQILWWEVDELALLFLTFFLGILTKQLTLLVGMGLVATFILSKVKNGKSDGFIFHLAYWYGVPGFQLRGAPDGSVREFVE